MRTLPEQLLDLVDSPGDDLAPSALVLARLEYRNLNAAQYLGILDAMGEEASRRIDREAGHEAPLEARVDCLRRYLHADLGFAGNRDFYEDPRNSCLNQVIDRRVGIPITLSLVYIEVARRAGLSAEGVNFPGHFLARMLDPGVTGPHGRAVLLDPFEGGTILGEADCLALLRKRVGASAMLDPDMLAPASRRDIIVRMLYNLKRNYVQMRSFPQARAVTDLLVALLPDSPTEVRDRGLLAYHLEDFSAALRDLEAYLGLARRTEQTDEEKKEAAQTWEHVKALRRRVAGFN
jgi:regulator of sirC expression with transglutaminase-like and TPR domain